MTDISKLVADLPTPDQIERTNAAVAANLGEDGTPKYQSAFGYSCALAAVIADDERMADLQRERDALRSALIEIEEKCARSDFFHGSWIHSIARTALGIGEG